MYVPVRPTPALTQRKARYLLKHDDDDDECGDDNYDDD